MLSKQEEAMKGVAAQRGLTGEEADAFVYGTMRRQGWKPEREKGKESSKPPAKKDSEKSAPSRQAPPSKAAPPPPPQGRRPSPAESTLPGQANPVPAAFPPQGRPVFPPRPAAAPSKAAPAKYGPKRRR